MTFTSWLQSEVYRKASGGTIALPAGEFFLDGCIKVPQGVTGLIIQGSGIDATTIFTTDKSHTQTQAFLFDKVDNCSLLDLTVDARDSQPLLGAVKFITATAIAVRRCRILGGKTCNLGFDTSCGTIVIEDCVFGGCGDLGPGLGRGLHVTTSSANVTVDGIRTYDDNLRHLVCLEDNVEYATVTDVLTEVAHDFAAVDLHGKLEGNAAVGSIAISNCAGRLNIGNDTHLNGSHATVINHDGQGKIIGVQQNSVLRYENITNGTITLYGNGSATNLGAPE